MDENSNRAWLPEFVYTDGQFFSDTAVVCNETGTIDRLGSADGVTTVRLTNQAVLPGLVNAHSHAFQRVIRGRTEFHTQVTDSFWTWRELMYRAANSLSPEDLYSVSRMAFLEMALRGITTVGEFHYLHHAPGGIRYNEPNLLPMTVIRAARDVGLRIALLRVAYARSGYEAEVNPLQSRFIEDSPDEYLKNLGHLRAQLRDSRDYAWAGIAPHSVRAVPLPYLKTIIEAAAQDQLSVHMHVAEQPAEVTACIEEYGRSPVAFLQTEGLLSEQFTAVHAIHVTSKGVEAIGKSGAMICACPTTERNLGDGVVPVDGYFRLRVPVSLGTDSQIQIDLLEDARELEYHLRLHRTERNVLAPLDDITPSALARRLFTCATASGAECLGFAGGELAAGSPADFFTVDLSDPSIAGASEKDLLPAIVFSLSSTAIRNVVVGGKRIIEDGVHPDQEEIVRQFIEVQKRLWGA